MIHPKWHPLRQAISLILINSNNQHQEIAGINLVKSCCAFIFQIASTVTSEVDVWSSKDNLVYYCLFVYYIRQSCVGMANSISFNWPALEALGDT